MRLPSLPVLILYRIFNAILPSCVSKCAIISDHFLFKYNELTLMISMSSPWESGTISISTSCTVQFLLLLHTFLKCPILLHAVHTFPYAGHCLGVWPPPQYLHGHLCCVAMFDSLTWVFFDSGAFLTLSNVLVSVMSFNMDTCNLYTSTLLAHANTSMLVICSLLFLDINSLIISSSITLLFNPWMNCSLSCQSTSLYPHSAAAMHKHPIHSSALSSSALHNFLNCSDLIISLNCGQTLLLEGQTAPGECCMPVFLPQLYFLCSITLFCLTNSLLWQFYHVLAHCM